MTRNNQQQQYAIGIDIGGTSIKSAVVSSQGEVTGNEQSVIQKTYDRDDVLNAITQAVRGALRHAGNMNVAVGGVGIGSPGIIDNGVVLGGAENLPGWTDVNLGGIISEAFDLPVMVDNDANVMGLAEAMYGAARGCSDVVFITVGTGIGGAIIANGQLIGGYRNRGSELGHVVVDHEGVDCNCGGRGCLEAYASTSALIRRYAAMTGMDEETVTGRCLIDRYTAGEEAAAVCLREHVSYLGHGIASFINVFAPQKVVIGGGISEAGTFYIDMVRSAALGYAMPDCARYTDVVAATLGNRAGCVGAASLIFRAGGKTS